MSDLRPQELIGKVVTNAWRGISKKTGYLMLGVVVKVAPGNSDCVSVKWTTSKQLEMFHPRNLIVIEESK